MQRLGWLPHTGQLKCTEPVDIGNLLAGRRTTVFIKGQSYDFTTEKVKVFIKERRARRDGISEPATYSGYELLVRVKDNQDNWHRCLPNPQGEHALIHDLEFLVEHFEIPKVPDLAALHPKKFAAYKRKLKQLESRACPAKPWRSRVRLGFPGRR